MVIFRYNRVQGTNKKTIQLYGVPKRDSNSKEIAK